MILPNMKKLSTDVQCIDYMRCADSYFLNHGMNWKIYSALKYCEMVK